MWYITASDYLPLLQIAEKKEVKGKQERETYTQLNAEFHGTARRGDAFFSEQCKETEENNSLGKARDHLKKIRDTKRMFHTKLHTFKDRNGKDLTETEEMKKRWKEYTQELYKTERS